MIGYLKCKRKADFQFAFRMPEQRESFIVPPSPTAAVPSLLLDVVHPSAYYTPFSFYLNHFFIYGKAIEKHQSYKFKNLREGQQTRPSDCPAH